MIRELRELQSFGESKVQRKRTDFFAKTLVALQRKQENEKTPFFGLTTPSRQIVKVRVKLELFESIDYHGIGELGLDFEIK